MKGFELIPQCPFIATKIQVTSQEIHNGKKSPVQKSEQVIEFKSDKTETIEGYVTELNQNFEQFYSPGKKVFMHSDVYSCDWPTAITDNNGMFTMTLPQLTKKSFDVNVVF